MLAFHEEFTGGGNLLAVRACPNQTPKMRHPILGRDRLVLFEPLAAPGGGLFDTSTDLLLAPIPFAKAINAQAPYRQGNVHERTPLCRRSLAQCIAVSPASL